METTLENVNVPSTIQLTLSALVVFCVVLCAYRTVKGPLSHLPGPFWSKLSNLPLQFIVLRGERVRYIHALHERYGSVVRISPREVSLADTSAIKTIYRVGGPYLKTEWYLAFTGQNAYRNLFNDTDFYAHGKHRRLTAANFSEKWVAKMEPYISKNVRLAIDRMAEEMKGQGRCDVFQWFTFMATDVIGEASFGESFRLLETGKKNQYIYDLENVASKGLIRAEFPWLLEIMRRVPFGPSKEIYNIVHRLQTYAQASLDRYWTQLRNDPDNTKATLLTKEYDAVEDGSMCKEQLQADARGNIIAGTDTTAITATNAVWLLAHHPEVEQDLIREVATLPSDFTDDDLRSLKVLGNVLTETLRLFGPVAQGLPRYVPKGGAEFCGHFVPEGKVVSIQSYTMARKPDVWENPEAFNPSRWDDPTKDMQLCFLPFGGGSRVCIGMHFAQLELRHALANFYRTFEGGVKMAYVEGFTEDDMTPMGFFLSPPKGKRCLVQRRK